jgi:hypothetical protein
MIYNPHRPRGVLPRLQDVLPELEDTPPAQIVHVPYPPKDVANARTILERLLAIRSAASDSTQEVVNQVQGN